MLHEITHSEAVDLAETALYCTMQNKLRVARNARESLPEQQASLRRCDFRLFPPQRRAPASPATLARSRSSSARSSAAARTWAAATARTWAAATGQTAAGCTWGGPSHPRRN
eukprot:967648-Rhodomonas_salina.1